MVLRNYSAAAVGSLLILGLLMVAPARCQDNDPFSDLTLSALPEIPEPPGEEVAEATLERVETLDRGMQELEELVELLQELGDPTKRQVGEESAPYLKRVDRVLKGRAHLIGLVGHHVKRMLKAKYQLEEELREYETWALEVDRRLKVLPEEYRQTVQRLEDEYTSIRPEVAVLAEMIYQELPAEDKAAETETDEAAYLQAYFNATDNGQRLVDSIPNRDQLAAKFQPLDLDTKRDKLEEMIARMVDIDYEVDLLNNVVIVETEAFSEMLPQAHRDVIRDAAQLLNSEEMKLLDDKAAQVSILAKYTAANLLLVQPSTPGETESAGRTYLLARQLESSMPTMERVLDELLEGKVYAKGRREVMNRRSISPNDRFLTPP